MAISKIGPLALTNGGGSVATNTASGTNALNANTSGAYNSAFGYSALQANTTGVNSTAIGYQAGYSNNANGLTVVGYQAGYSNTSGTRLAALGAFAGYSNTTGANNTAIGLYASYSNATGSNNTAVGQQALYFNVGSYNTAVGEEALINNLGGGNNTAQGYQALFSNTSASNCVAVGYQAGYSSSTGGFNIFMGTGAGYSNTGNSNLMLGSYSGQNSTGSNNTFVGCNTPTAACAQAMTTGSKNTILGGYSGNQGGLDIRTASNYIVLSDGDGNPRGYSTGANSWVFNSNSGDSYVYLGSGGATKSVMFWYSSLDRLYMNNGGSAGVYMTNGATSWTANSDERTKDIIEPITNGAEKVASLRAVIGKYKTDAEGTRRSFLIAQDVQAVLPEAVSADDPELLGVSYTDVIPLLVAAIKELKAEIDEYKRTHP